MTPERIAILCECITGWGRIEARVQERIRAVIAAACAEERKAALTEAAEACKAARGSEQFNHAISAEIYAAACEICATAIELLRDQ